jgi:ATP-binding cassette subfamily B protein
MFSLLKRLRPYRWTIVLTLFLILIQTLCELLLPTLMAQIVDKGIVNGDRGSILGFGVQMLVTAVVDSACAIGAAYFSSRVSLGFGRDLRSAVFNKVESFSLHEFEKFGTSTLITRSTNDVVQIQTFSLQVLRMMVMAPLMSLGGLAMAIGLDPELALVLLAGMPLLALTISWVARRGMKYFRQMQTKLDQLNLVLRENLLGVRVIRAFHRESTVQEKFRRANEDLAETAFRAMRIMAALMPAMMLLMSLSSIAIVWFGGWRIVSGQLQVGSMMAFLQYAIQILFSLMMMSMLFVMLPRAAVSAGRLEEVLSTKTEISDIERPLEFPTEGAEVEFDHVTFRYPGAEDPVLFDVSFCSRAGETTAIIGGTGAGKSTLLNLVPRFYDVESGRILVGGVDVRALSQAELRRHIGYVPQKALLFSDSVAENLRYGDPEADPENLAQALLTAQAADFVGELPEGMGTPLSKGGNTLSGGQKQRLCIARALVRKPLIYLFDDAFSALDFKTDTALRQALAPQTAQAVVLVVAQRISSIQDADRIIVLDEGRVAGIGRHKELLQTCAVYREIAASQAAPGEIL